MPAARRRRTAEDEIADDAAEASGGVAADPRRTNTRQQRARRRVSELPDEDPFLLIEGLNERGGRDGTRPTMPPKVLRAFRVYCLLHTQLRTLTHLRRQLERELDEALAQERQRKADKGEDPGELPPAAVAPSLEILRKWRGRYDWEGLVGEYDLALARWRLLRNEQRIEAMNERQAASARQLQANAQKQIATMLAAYNAPAGDPKTWAKDPRSGRPIPPRRSLSGMQAMASLYDVAVRTERVALGAPTTIAQTRSDLDARLAVVDPASVLSLDEWRRKSASERAALADRSPIAGLLPAPGAPSGVARPAAAAARAPLAHLAPDALDPEDAAQLPDGWFAGDGEERPLGADPLAATGSRDDLDFDPDGEGDPPRE